jgi:hypothetical protein
MQPRDEDRLSAAPVRRGPSAGLLIAVASVLVAGAYFFFIDDSADVPATSPIVEPPASVAIAVPAKPLAPAPDIPRIAPEPEARPTEVVPQAPAVTLGTSDAALRQTVVQGSDSALLQAILAQDQLVERGAGLVDGLNRGLVPRNVLPIKPPAGSFSTQEIDGQVYVAPAAYRRYDSYTDAIAALDTAQLAAAFQSVRPLLEQAYATLGYAPQEFDNALIRTLDQILDAPEIREPIAVQRVEAIYKYSDPALESLTPLQKQMLRMGPDNTVKIKLQAAALRRHLLQANAAE